LAEETILRVGSTIRSCVLILATVAGSSGGSRAHALAPAKGPTVQVMCGLRPGDILTRDQATCIARLMGLDDGICPWSVDLVGEGEEQDWSIWNTTETLGTCACGTKGQALTLHPHSGRLKGLESWSSDCVPFDGDLVSSQSAIGVSGSTVQVQCGVRQGGDLTREQAMCIATLADFDRGVCPWKMKAATHRERTWSVTNTSGFAGNCVCGAGGETLYINIHTGQLMNLGWWSGGCVG